MIKGNKLIITWCTQDVIERAKERGIEITESQAQDILENADHHHDATIGINWDVLDVHTDWYLSHLKEAKA